MVSQASAAHCIQELNWWKSISFGDDKNITLKHSNSFLRTLKKIPNLSNKMNRQLSKLEQSPATAPKTWCTKLWTILFTTLIIPGHEPQKLGVQYHGITQLRTTNQQVHWVVQVIPYVSKGRIPRRLLVWSKLWSPCKSQSGRYKIVMGFSKIILK